MPCLRRWHPETGGMQMAELANIPGAVPLLVDRREAGRLLSVSPGTIDNQFPLLYSPSRKISLNDK